MCLPSWGAYGSNKLTANKRQFFSRAVGVIRALLGGRTQLGYLEGLKILRPFCLICFNFVEEK